MTVLRAVAGYLPGIDPAELQWQTLAFASAQQRLEVDVPVLSGAQMNALAARVAQAARARLKTLTVSQIVAIVDRAIARLLDPADPYRRELDRLLPIVTGYDAEMIRLGLTNFFKTFRAPQLHRFVAEDFANPKLLDEFQPRAKGGAARAFGPQLLVHVWAGNVPACRSGALSAACSSRPATSASCRAPSHSSPGCSRGCSPKSTRRFPIASPWCGGRAVTRRRPRRSMPAPTWCWRMAATRRCSRSAARCRSPHASWRTATSSASA